MGDAISQQQQQQQQQQPPARMPAPVEAGAGAGREAPAAPQVKPHQPLPSSVQEACAEISRATLPPDEHRLRALVQFMWAGNMRFPRAFFEAALTAHEDIGVILLDEALTLCQKRPSAAFYKDSNFRPLLYRVVAAKKKRLLEVIASKRIVWRVPHRKAPERPLIDERTPSSVTALFLAASMGDRDMVSILLQHGANREIPNCKGITPAGSTIITRHQKELGDLLPFVVDHSYGKLSMLFRSFANNLEFAMEALKKDPDLASLEVQGKTFLRAAVSSGRIDLVKSVLDISLAKIDTVGKKNYTPVMLACKTGRSDIVKLLLEKGADYRGTCTDGYSLLAIAAERNDTDTARLLVDLPEKVQYFSTGAFSSYYAPLYMVAKSGYMDFLKILLDAGFSPDGNVENTPLLSDVCSCIWTGSLERVVRLLIERGADINKRDASGCTPIWNAARAGRLDAVRLLHELGAQQLPSNRGHSPALAAYTANRQDVVNYLGSIGVDISRLAEQADLSPDLWQWSYGSSATYLNIMFDDILESSCMALTGVTSHSQLMAIKIRYADSTGEQAGSDQGGLFRDWLGRLASVVFSKNHGLMDSCTVDGVEYFFISNYFQEATGLLQISPDVVQRFYRMLGLICGISVKHRVPLGVDLAPHLCKALLSVTPTFEDLKFVSPGLYSSLKSCIDDSRSADERAAAIEELRDALGELTFDMPSRAVEARATLGVGTSEASGLPKQYSELCDHGSEKQATVDNIMDYATLLVKKRLLDNVSTPSAVAAEAFSLAFSNLASLTPDSIAKSIAGDASIEVDKFKANCCFNDSSTLRDWFWEYVTECSPQKRMNLITWITGLKRLPPAGFSGMGKNVTVNVHGNVNALPVAHTCSFTLDLPRYTTKESLYKGLDICIEHGQVFGVI